MGEGITKLFPAGSKEDQIKVFSFTLAGILSRKFMIFFVVGKKFFA